MSGPRGAVAPWTAVARRTLRPPGARELGGMVTSAVLFSLGLTEPTSTGLLRLLSAGQVPCRVVTTPVVLVHGYGGNRSNWRPLEVRLGAAGFVSLHAMRYNALTTDLPRLAEQLVEDCRTAMRETGVDRVHVVGHSLGGLVLRYAVACHGLGEHLDTGITIASPHAGTAVARLGRGAVAADLRPGSRRLAEIAAAPTPPGVRWVGYWSDADLVVPGRSARLAGSLPGAVDVAVPGEGHLSILRATALLADVEQRLLQAEAVPGHALAVAA